MPGKYERALRIAGHVVEKASWVWPRHISTAPPAIVKREPNLST